MLKHDCPPSQTSSVCTHVASSPTGPERGYIFMKRSLGYRKHGSASPSTTESNTDNLIMTLLTSYLIWGRFVQILSTMPRPRKWAQARFSRTWPRYMTANHISVQNETSVNVPFEVYREWEWDPYTITIVVCVRILCHKLPRQKLSMVTMEEWFGPEH